MKKIKGSRKTTTSNICEKHLGVKLIKYVLTGMQSPMKAKKQKVLNRDELK